MVEQDGPPIVRPGGLVGGFVGANKPPTCTSCIRATPSNDWRA
jgi:hypothetical protein